MSGRLRSNDTNEDDKYIKGGTNDTIIGNTGDSLKVVFTNTNLSVTQGTSPWVTSRNWNLASANDFVAAVQSGTWNINNISGTISLPTGASTSALQTTGNTFLSSLDTKAAQQSLNYGASTGGLRTSSQIGNATGAADFAAGNSSAQTLRVVVATNQSAIPASQSGTWNIAALTSITNPVTVNQGTSPWTVSGTVTANAGTGTFQTNITNASLAVTGPLTDTQLRATPVPVSGTVTANAGTGTFAISAASLPLPSGASTAANQATIISSLSSIDAGIPTALGQTTMAASMPVTIASNQTALPVTGTISATTIADLSTSYSPDYASFLDGTSNLLVDASGRLETHSTVLTDEGSFRDDFIGSSLTTSIGNVAFTNGSTTLTGTGFFTSLVAGRYVKKSADADSLYVRIMTVDSDTSATTETAYAGTTAAAAAVCANYQPTIGAGGSLAVASSLLSINSGTTSGSSTYLVRGGDYLPYVYQFKAAVSQRIANQVLTLGLSDVQPAPEKGVYIQFDGTSSNTIKCVSQASSAAADIQTTTVVVPTLNTSAQNSYQISLTNNQASFVVNGKVVATHTDHIPNPYDKLILFNRITNNAVVTNTTLAIDWQLFYNTDQLEVGSNFLGEPSRVIIQGSATTTGLPIDLQTDSSGNLVVTTLNGFGADFTFGDITTAALTRVPVRRTTYNEPAANAQLRLVSASAADAAAGTGARTVRIVYFDQTGAGPFTETVTLNGTTPVNTVGTNLCFIEEMQVITAGSGGTNAGIITLQTLAAATVGTIGATDRQTFWAHHYVALGKTCRISGLSASHNGTTVGSGGVFTLLYQPIGVANAIETQVSDFHRLYGQASTTPRTYTSPIIVAGPARIVANVTPETTSSTVYRASIDFSEF